MTLQEWKQRNKQNSDAPTWKVESVVHVSDGGSQDCVSLTPGYERGREHPFMPIQK